MSFARPSSSAKITPTKVRRFSGVSYKSATVLRKSDERGYDVSDSFANDMADLDCYQKGCMTVRDGKRKHMGPFGETIDGLFSFRMSGTVYVALLNSGALSLDAVTRGSVPTGGLPPSDPWAPPESDANGDDTNIDYPNRLIISDQGNDRIILCDIPASDATQGVWTVLTDDGAGDAISSPRHLWYDEDTEMIYLADTGNDRIIATKIDGTGWTTMGASGSGDYQFDYPYGICYDHGGGFVYVGERDNGRVVQTNMAGTHWVENDGTGFSDYRFNSVRGVYFDPSSGYVYAVDDWGVNGPGGSADDTKSRIVKFKIGDTDWTATLKPSDVGDPTDFVQPRSVLYHSDSECLYITDRDNDRIIKTKIDGTGWTVLEGFDQPRGVFYDHTSQAIHCADSAGNRVVRSRMTGEYRVHWFSNGSGTGQVDGARYCYGFRV